MSGTYADRNLGIQRYAFTLGISNAKIGFQQTKFRNRNLLLKQSWKYIYFK